MKFLSRQNKYTQIGIKMMKRFVSFLEGKQKNNKEEALLVLHKLYGGFDTTHIEKKSNHFEINVGQVVKDKNYKSLNIVFKKGPQNVRLATRNSNQDFYIVIEFPQFTTEMTHQDLLNKIEEKETGDKLHQVFEKFLNEAKDEFHDSNRATVHEIRSKDNQEFDKRYDDLMKAFQAKVTEYKSAIADLDNTANANVAKSAAVNMAKKSMKVEYFGDNFKKFLSNLMQLPEAKFINNLESETKKKILARLENFYDHYVEK